MSYDVTTKPGPSLMLPLHGTCRAEVDRLRGIVRDLERQIAERPSPDLFGRACQWVVGRDTGLSSMTIWAVMMGVECPRPTIPHDLDDFGRCYRLLEALPEWHPRLAEMAAKYPEWTPIIDAWPAWEARYLAPEHQRVLHSFDSRAQVVVTLVGKP